MGIIDKLKTQLIEIIEWLDNTNDTMVYRFPGVYENAIKNGAQLIVREGQSAVFVNEGKIADVDEKVRHLQAIRQALVRMTATCTGRGPLTNCSILEALNGQGEF